MKISADIAALEPIAIDPEQNDSSETISQDSISSDGRTDNESKETKKIKFPHSKDSPIANVDRNVSNPNNNSKNKNLRPQQKRNLSVSFVNKNVLPIKQRSLRHYPSKSNSARNIQQKYAQQLEKITSGTNISPQKSIVNVMEQRRLLVDILRDHEKMQKERWTISTEVKQMKAHLSELQSKLDKTLKKLR